MVYQVCKRPQNHLARSLWCPGEGFHVVLTSCKASSQADSGALLALLLTWLIPLHFLSSQTAHLRLWWCISLCKVPGLPPHLGTFSFPGGSDLLSWHLLSSSGNWFLFPALFRTSALLLLPGQPGEAASWYCSLLGACCCEDLH